MQKPLLLNKDKIGRFHIFFTIFIGMYIMWMCYYYLITQIHECHDVARLIVVVALIGNPHFDACDVHTRRHQRQP